jgi:hypothetical protein
MVVPAERNIGLQLMTVSMRPVVQAVKSPALRAQGLAPCDVLVSINGRAVGDVTAVEAAQMLAEARRALDHEDDKALRGARAGLGRRVKAIKLGVLRMAPQDSQSSYNSQHPVDIAAALSSYDPVTKIGVLSFSLPHNLQPDRYRVEVNRFGSQVVPMGGSSERDHTLRVTRHSALDALAPSTGRFAEPKDAARDPPKGKAGSAEAPSAGKGPAGRRKSRSGAKQE